MRVTMYGRKRRIKEIGQQQLPASLLRGAHGHEPPHAGHRGGHHQIAMVRVERSLREEGLRAKLVLQIHDELDLEVPDDEVTAVSQLVEQAMEGVVELLVPLRPRSPSAPTGRRPSSGELRRAHGIAGGKGARPRRRWMTSACTWSSTPTDRLAEIPVRVGMGRCSYTPTPRAGSHARAQRRLSGHHEQPHGAHGGHRRPRGAHPSVRRGGATPTPSTWSTPLTSIGSKAGSGRGWKTAAKQPVKNPDLWRRLLSAMGPHDVTWVLGEGSRRPRAQRALSTSLPPRRPRVGPREDSGFSR